MPKPQFTVLDIRNKVKQYQGRQVRLEAHKSKKKLYQKIGFIEGIYPSIFTVNVVNNDHNQRISFSYIDLLTNNVTIHLVDSNNALC